MKYYIVDDNLGTVKTLEKIINARGLGTVTGYSTDPADAIEDILEDSPDIVLVDLLMDGIDGIELVNKVKKRNNNISFIMISKVMDKEIIQKAYNSGIEFFITKPVNVIEVENVARNIAEKIKIKNMMANIKNMFELQDLSGEGETETDAAGEESNVDILLGTLGMLGEKGTKDIKVLFSYMNKYSCDYTKSLLDDIASTSGDTVKNVEQRIRRAIKKGLYNAAQIGIDDYENEAFSVYANYVYDFKSLKDEMNYIEGRGNTPGRINISKFMEGLILYNKVSK